MPDTFNWRAKRDAAVSRIGRVEADNERLRAVVQVELARHIGYPYAFSDGFFCGGCARQPDWPCAPYKALTAALSTAARSTP